MIILNKGYSLLAAAICMVAVSTPTHAWRSYGGGSGVAFGAHGGSAAWSHPTYGYGYSYGYRPPVYYGGGYSGGDVAAAGIAGLAVGAMAGAAAASSYPPPSTTVVVQQPMASAPLALGTSLTYLPGGCVSITYNSAQYYQCGTNWFRTYFGSNGAFYQVVPAPY